MTDEYIRNRHSYKKVVINVVSVRKIIEYLIACKVKASLFVC